MSTASFVLALVLLAAGTYALRFGGVAAGSRTALTDDATRWVERAVAVLLVAVVVTGTFDEGPASPDVARATGVAAGMVAALVRVPLVGVVLVAALTTAGLRAA